MCTAKISVVPRGTDYQVDLRLGQDDQPVASVGLPGNLEVGQVPPVVSGEGHLADRISAYFRECGEDQEGFAEIGRYLRHLLLRDEVGQQWALAKPERTLLCFHTHELRLLPWELMWGEEGSYFVKPRNLFMRACADGLESDTEPSLLPIKVLVVVGDRNAAIGSDTEVHAIKTALAGTWGRIEAEFLYTPTKTELRDRYRQVKPHIFHFIGHGERKPGTNESALRVEAPARAWSLTATYIRTFLDSAPRVAILNACRSGDVTDVGALTDAFLAIRTAAVVGMQGDIRGEAAAMFGGQFYRELAADEPIDSAVTKARQNLYLETGFEDGSRDWALPSLTLQVRPEQVLSPRAAISVEHSRAFNRQLARWVQVFVNRSDERQTLVSGVDPESDDPAEWLLVVTGDQEVGKTSLLHWLRRRCALRGRRVKYVNCKAQNKLDFLRTLYAIRDQAEDMPFLGPDVSNAFDQFNHDLMFIEQGVEPAEAQELRHLAGPAPTPAKPTQGHEHWVDRAFQSFRESLGKATEDEPLVLILDHVGQIQHEEFQNYLYPKLIQPVARGELPGLRLVLALSTAEADYLPEDSGGLVVPVPRKDKELFESLAVDALLAQGTPVCDASRAVIRYLSPKESWIMKELADMASRLRAAG